MLSAEQRRALAMLATPGHGGVTQPFLIAHGFRRVMIGGLVNHGLVILTRENIRAGSKAGILAAFDSHRDLIHMTAADVYRRGRKGSYELIPADF